jgi:hypothetical protein
MTMEGPAFLVSETISLEGTEWKIHARSFYINYTKITFRSSYRNEIRRTIYKKIKNLTITTGSANLAPKLLYARQALLLGRF